MSPPRDPTSPPAGAPSQPAPRPASGDHRDPHFDQLMEDVEFDLWERETDAIGAETLREAWERFADTPAARQALRALRKVGPAAIERATHALLSRGRDRHIDEFGLDESFLEDVFPVAKWFHDHYFRVGVRGIEHIPAQGRVLIEANHSGALPYDAAMLMTAVKVQHPAHRLVRALVEDFVYHFPFLGAVYQRAGSVRACQENALRLLHADQAVLVFPEGVKGIGKLYRHKYRLQRFGRGGAVKLAMNASAPVVPAAIVGAEESMPLLGKVSWLARPLGLPYIPLTPTMPWLGPLGLIPFPTKWTVDFAPAVDMAEYGPEGAHDRVLVNQVNQQIRQTIQEMIDLRLRERHSIWR